MYCGDQVCASVRRSHQMRTKVDVRRTDDEKSLDVFWDAEAMLEFLSELPIEPLTQGQLILPKIAAQFHLVDKLLAASTPTDGGTDGPTPT